jgi:outer membrane immunogenic protein
MRKILVGSTLIAGLLTGPALAADIIPRPLPPPPPAVVYRPPPIFTWTGFYIGVNAGWHRSRDNDSSASILANNFWIPANVAIMNAALPNTLTGSGFAGGGQIGYNWQFSQFVFGVEADIMGLSGSGNRTLIVPWFNPTQQATLIDSAKDSWMSTFRGRAGFAIDRVLFYGTGGLAVAKWSIAHSYSDNFTFGAPFTGTPLTIDSVKTTRSGWTAGGGIEWAVSYNWTVRGEYLYAQFGTVNSTLTFVNPSSGVGATLGHSDHLSENIVRAAINYKFGGPVVAGY